MATYKGIQGYTVQKLSDDPTASEAAGQLWYNSSSGKFKVGTAGAGAWSSGGSMPNTKWKMAGCGLQTAALIAGGQRPPGSVTESETYDGTSWTEVNNINSARRGLPGVGTQTAGMIMGGFPGGMDVVEQYDGTSWSEKNDLLTGRQWSGAAGTTTAALFWSGYTPSSGDNKQTEKWDGTSWSEVNDLNTARYYARSAAGISTAALCIGGWIQTPPAKTQAVEEYDGTSWSEKNDLNEAKEMRIACGTSTAALVYGGGPVTGATEKYDGTSWTEVADMATARTQLGSATAAPSGVGLATGGDPATEVVQERNDPVNPIKTVTVS